MSLLRLSLTSLQVRQLMRTGPSLACDVKMAWPVERTPLGKDEAEPEPGSRHLWTCGSCATFKPVSHEAIAWEHALDTVRPRVSLTPV